jgi:hypothetical protein
MRIKTIAGVAFAGAAAAAVVAGGVAYASDGDGGGERLRIVYEDQGNRSGTTADLREDCPEKSGGGSAPESEAPGGSSEAPGTQAPADSL